jgi:hypothetical protein
VAANSNLGDARALGRVLYLLALLLIVGPLSQWVVVVWPMHFDFAQWRYGAIGLLEERVTLPMIGLFVAIVSANLLDQRAIQGILAGVSLAAGPIFVVLALTISLDGLQLRHTVRPEQVGGFDSSLARTVIVLLYASVVAGALGWAALKSRRKKESRRRESTPIALRRPSAKESGA